MGVDGREGPLVQSSVALNDGDLRAGRAGARVPWPARCGGERERGVEGGGGSNKLLFALCLFVQHCNSPPALLPHSVVRDTSMASSTIQHDAVQIHHKTYVRASSFLTRSARRCFAICRRPPVQRRRLLRPHPPASGFWTHQFARGAVHVRGEGPCPAREPLPPLPPLPPLSPSQTTFRVRTIVAGDAAIGKTALLKLVTSGGSEYPRNYVMTSVPELSSRLFRVPPSDLPAGSPATQVDLILLDTPGSNTFNVREGAGSKHVRCP